MKGMRRQLWAVLAGVLLCLAAVVFLPAPEAGAAEKLLGSGSCGYDVAWTLDRDGVLTISGTGAMTDYTGVEPSWGWSSQKKKVKKLVVEEGVSTIGKYAFLSCSNLWSVTLPEGLESIGARAFYGCDTLREIVLPGTVAEIGDLAFVCKRLRSIVIPASVTDSKRIGLDGAPCTIYGVPGTVAEKYAKEVGLKFQELSTVSKRKNKVTVRPITKITDIKKARTFDAGAFALGGAHLTYQSDQPAIVVSGTGKITVPKGFAGTATITVKAAATLRYEETSASFLLTVKPAAGAVSDVTNEKGGKLAVKWKKNATGSGYQLQYSTDKSFKKKVTTKTIGRNGTTSATYKGLTKGKTYYVRIRTVKKSGKTTLYSAWSGAKSVKISK